MSFWAVLFLALGALWLQALVIQLSALYALRAQVRARWDALVALERLCLSRILEAPDALAGVHSGVLREWEVALQGRLLPEDPAALVILGDAGGCLDRVWPETEARWREESRVLGIPGRGETLYLRLKNARQSFDEAVRAYELRRPALRMEGVVAWFGYKPHSTVGRTPKVG
jgi:hypothetical protein